MVANTQTKTSATTHSGWGGGDARIFENNVCRSGSNNDWYYAYTYGFSTLGAGDTVTGIRIRHTVSSDGGSPANQYEIQLTNATTVQGTKKDAQTAPAEGNCTNMSTIKTHGGISDLWGLSAAAAKTLINNSNFGVALHIEGFGANTYYEDGFEIVVYYDSEVTDYIDVPLKISLNPYPVEVFKEVPLKISLDIFPYYKDIPLKMTLESAPTYIDVPLKISFDATEMIIVDSFMNIPRSNSVGYPSDLAHQGQKVIKVRRGLKK